MTEREQCRIEKAMFEAKKRSFLEMIEKLDIDFKTCNGMVRRFIMDNYGSIEDIREPFLDAFLQRDPDFMEPERIQTSLLDIAQRWSVLKRAHWILETCDGAHPAAVFQFCIDHPKGGPKEFQELKSKMRTVFRILGDRIFAVVEEMVRKETGNEGFELRLDGTPLEEEFALYREETQRFCSVRHHLSKTLDKTTVDRIVYHPVYSEYIKNSKNDKRTAKKLETFWKARFKRFGKLKDQVLPLELEDGWIPFKSCYRYIYGIENDIRETGFEYPYDEFVDEEDW